MGIEEVIAWQLPSVYERTPDHPWSLATLLDRLPTAYAWITWQELGGIVTEQAGRMRPDNASVAAIDRLAASHPVDPTTRLASPRLGSLAAPRPFRTNTCCTDLELARQFSQGPCRVSVTYRSGRWPVRPVRYTAAGCPGCGSRSRC